MRIHRRCRVPGTHLSWIAPLIVALAAGVARPAGAQTQNDTYTSQPDETLPGFKSNSVLFSGGVDNVNAFSGDTGIDIPLGPRYALGPGHTWQLQAYNTLKFWFETDSTCTDGTLDGTAFVQGWPTLGVGWTLSLGQVAYLDDIGSGYAGLVYISPDGGVHRTDSSGITEADPRLRVSCTGSPTTSCKVEFPDGSVGTFGHQIPMATPVAQGDKSIDFILGHLSSIFGLTDLTDAYGTTLLTAEYGSSGAPAWGLDRITLSSGSQIAFSWTTLPTTATGWNGSQEQATWPVLSSVQFPAIGQGGETETVNFAINAGPFQRNTLDNTATVCSTNPGDWDQEYVLAPLLDAITFKRSAVGSQPVSYTMTYQNNGADPTNGGIISLGLPTGATIKYDLTGGGVFVPCSNFPVGDLETADSCGTQAPTTPSGTCHFCEFVHDNGSVKERTVVDTLNPSTVLSDTQYSRTTYTPTYFPEQAKGTGQLTRVVEITEPYADSGLGRVSRYLFHVADIQGNDDPTMSGIELEHTISEGAAFGNSPLRTYVNCEDATYVGLTSTFCGYLTDSGQVNNFASYGLQHPKGTVTWYGAKPSALSGGACSDASEPTCASTLMSSWAPSAYRYGVSTTNSANNADPSYNINRSITTTWTPSTSQAWLPHLFDKQVTTDGTMTIEKGFEFDSPDTNGKASTGFVRGEWVYADPSLDFSVPDQTGHNEVMTLQCNYPEGIDGTHPDGDGNTGQDFTAAYTDQWVSGFLANICSQNYPTIPATGAIGLQNGAWGHTIAWQHGKVLNDHFLKDDGAGHLNTLPWMAFDVDRDASTGLILMSRSPNSSLATGYGYDGFGRLVSIQPPGGRAPTAISIDDTNRLTTVSRSGSDGNSTWEQYVYDLLGRLSREIRQMPSEYAVRTHEYDLAGHAVFVSEWQSCPSVATCESLTVSHPLCPSSPASVSGTHGLLSCAFDAFDRPTQLYRADGSYTIINRTDTGVSPPITYSDTEETDTVYSADGTTASGSTITRRDTLGRIVEVTEPDVGSGADVTDYTYNVFDKIAGVTQGLQTRSFLYDGLGFLQKEINPETNPDSGGSSPITYPSYSSLGDVITRVAAGNTYTYTYDAARRFWSEAVGSTLYTADCYDGTTTGGASSGCPSSLANTGGGGYPYGEITRRYAYNPSVTGAPSVVDDFSYGDPAGALTSKAVTVNGTPYGNPQAISAWSYDTLGLITTYTHPRVTGYSSPVETRTYSLGFLSDLKVDGNEVAANIAYNPSGGLSQWNGPALDVNGDFATTTITPDDSGMPRPKEISTTYLGSALWDSGAYTYDGAGNITRIGNDTFGYDLRSRLTSSTVDSASQTFAYDRWGNLTAVNGIYPRSLAVNTATNHLQGALYDGLGNFESITGNSELYSYDPLSREYQYADSYNNPPSTEDYIYDASGERVGRLNNGQFANNTPTLGPSGSVSQYSDLRFASGSASTSGAPTGEVRIQPPPPQPNLVNNSEFMSQSVQVPMNAGQTYEVSVTFLNTGTTTWTSTQNYRIVSQNPPKNTTWGLKNVKLAYGESVAPNQEKTFIFTVTAPTTPGTYNFQWTMAYSSTYQPFGQMSQNVAVTVSSGNPTDAATFVSQTAPPSSMWPNQQASVSITLQNTGTTTWTPAGDYELGSQSPMANSSWGFTAVALSAGDSIAPGQSKTFSFTITAPATPGTYNFQWEMADGSTYFGALSTNVAVTVTSAVGSDDATFVGQSVPSTMTAGQPYTVSVTMQNSGTSTWTAASNYRLGSQNPQDNQTWALGRVLLDSGDAIAPGQSKTFSFTVTAPSTPGTYNFQWQMLIETVHWFGQMSQNQVVTVTSGGPTDGAAFVSQTSPPSSMSPNQQATVSVTFQNTGTTTWTPAGNYQLGSQNPMANTNWGFSSVVLSAGDSIAPGQSKTFSFTITAPATPGTYNFQWEMADGSTYFGALSTNVAVTVSSGGGADGAAYVTQSQPPSSLTPGEQVAVSVTLQNTGTTTWTPAGQYQLGSQNPPGNTTWGFSTVALSTGDSIAPGQTKTFYFTVTAPSTPGTYNFEWQMMDGSTYFGDLSPNVQVTVATGNAFANWYLGFRDGDNLVSSEYLVTSGGLVPERHYFHLGNLLVALEDGNGNYTYYTSDHLGSPRIAFDRTGTITETHVYLPWGDPYIDSSTETSLERFAKMEWDPSSGKHYDNARFRSAVMGRFLSIDQARGTTILPRSWNRYAYALDNPLKLVDRSGQQVATAGAVFVSDPYTLLPVAYFAAATYAIYAYYTMRLTAMSHLPMTAAQALTDAQTRVGSSPSLQDGRIPSLPYPGSDPTVAPDPSWNWVGPDVPGGERGAWQNPANGDSFKPDLDNEKEGPHWDYNRESDRTQWRFFPDGRVEPKNKNADRIVDEERNKPPDEKKSGLGNGCGSSSAEPAPCPSSK